MINFIKADLFRYSGCLRAKSFIITYFLFPGFRYTFFLRISNKFNKYSFLGIISRIFLNSLGKKFGYQIMPRTSIGKGFHLLHFGAVVINPNAIIGNYCSVAQGVTIGQSYKQDNMGSPLIGNYVWIGTNAVVVGKINIGNNVLIAPGAFVNFDCPDNCVVVGNPGKIIEKMNPTKDYIKNILQDDKQ